MSVSFRLGPGPWAIIEVSFINDSVTTNVILYTIPAVKLKAVANRT